MHRKVGFLSLKSFQCRPKLYRLHVLLCATHQPNPSYFHVTATKPEYKEEEEEHDHVAAYTSQLRSCSSTSDLSKGLYIHHSIVKHGIQDNSFLHNPVLHMYCKCGAIYEAQSVFSRHLWRTAYSWDFIIRAYIDHGNNSEALLLFNRMQHEAILPDKVIYCSAVSACCDACESLSVGRRIHACVIVTPFLSDIVLITALVGFYNRCGLIHDAHRLFHQCEVLDVISCNAMIDAYAQNEQKENALFIFEQMQWEGLFPNNITLLSLLSVCNSKSDLSLGKIIHIRIITGGLAKDVCVATAVISMYGRCGSLQDGKRLFFAMHEKDIIMWNAVIAAYVQNGLVKDALLLYYQLQQEGLLLNRVTCVSVLQACASEIVYCLGKQVHSCMKYINDGSEVVIGNVLITMYGNCGNVDYARSIFEQITSKDVVSWSAMIGAYAHHGHAVSAIHVLFQMEEESVEPNEATLVNVISACIKFADVLVSMHLHTWLIANSYAGFGDVGNAIISMYAKSGCLEDASELLNKMDWKDTVSWNALISAYAQHGHGKDALQLFGQMLVEGVFGDCVTFANILTAYADNSELLGGQRVHAQLLNSEVNVDAVLHNSLLNMYGKCGLIMNSHNTFIEMTGRNLISWNSMISGIAQLGDGMTGLHFLQKMYEEGVKPNSITFVSVFTSCSHAGLVDECLSCFDSMSEKYGVMISIDHLNCIIDLLGRPGMLTQLWYLINHMPFQPTGISYTSVLNICRQHYNMYLGQFSADHAFELIPDDTAVPMLISNLWSVCSPEE